MSSPETFAKNLETAVCNAVGVDPLRVRIAELEDEAKRARDDEAWAHERTVTVDFAPAEKGWEAGFWDGEQMISGKGKTIHAALRTLRAKVEGGAR